MQDQWPDYWFLSWDPAEMKSLFNYTFTYTINGSQNRLHLILMSAAPSSLFFCVHKWVGNWNKHSRKFSFILLHMLSFSHKKQASKCFHSSIQNSLWPQIILSTENTSWNLWRFSGQNFSKFRSNKSMFKWFSCSSWVA